LHEIAGKVKEIQFIYLQLIYSGLIISGIFDNITNRKASSLKHSDRLSTLKKEETITIVSIPIKNKVVPKGDGFCPLVLRIVLSFLP
jgi:hypothetical protein